MTIKEKQKRVILADFNTKKFPKPKFESAIRLFEAQVRKTPNNTAIEFGRKKITYSQLNQKTNVIGNFLTCFLKGNQQKIYLLADKNIEMIAALLGILKSENILIPLNQNYPPPMIREVFREVKPDLIITQKKYLYLLKKMSKHLSRLNILTLDDFSKGIFKKANLKQEKNRQTSKNLYSHIYFTSGSIGRPKAVLGTTLGGAAKITCLLTIMKNYLKNKSRIGHFFSTYMDIFTFNLIMNTLCCGATLCLPESNNLLINIPHLVKWLKDNKITYTSFPTNFLKYFAAGIKNKNQLNNLKFISIRGDKLIYDKYLKNFFNKIGLRTKLFNTYSMTEIPVAFYHEITKANLDKNIIPIGKSSGGKATVLNDKKEIQLAGEIGEIYIRSPFFKSSGYYNSPELTRKVFIKNPFSRHPNDIVFKTGDLGRLLADGNIEVLGRSDDQIKISGFRVGLSEIESKILSHPKIKECVVLAKKNKKRENYLVAYFTANGLPDLETYLKAGLPDYMIPTSFIRLKKFPLLPSGKINKLALANLQPEQIKETKQYQLPTSQLEKQLIKIWNQILGLKKISVNDNFFELGGSSLNIIAINNKLMEQFDIAIPLTVIFQNPTVKEFAVFLKNKLKKKRLEKVSVIKKTSKERYYPVSQVQKDFWLSSKKPDSTFLNMVHIIKFTGPLNVKILQKALQKIIKRHEILRTNFLEINGEVFQVIRKNAQPTMKIVNLSKGNKLLKALREEAKKKTGQIQLGKFTRKEIYKPFDLKKDLLLRLILIKTRQKYSVIILVVHNIIWDTLSYQVFINELLELYKSYSEKKPGRLSSLPLQFKDYANWKHLAKHGKIKERQKKYWSKKLKGDLGLPLHFPMAKTPAGRQPSLVDNTELLIIEDKEMLKRIKSICRRLEITTFMFVLALLDIFLFKVTGERDLIVGSNVNLRNSPKLARLIGPIFNIQALRNKLASQQNFTDVLKTAKKTILESLINREYSFTEFLENKKISKNSGRSFWNVFLEYPFKYKNNQIKKIKFYAVKDSFEKISFALKLSIEEPYFDKLLLRFIYNPNLFSRKQIKKFAQNFKEIFEQVIFNPHVKINNLKITKK
jgi:acyl-coenzyme A synthetase/AMP-(fatty) acid ligase/acyl carrier protein